MHQPAPADVDDGSSAGWLLQRMATRRDLPALVWADTVCSYGELLALIQRRVVVVPLTPLSRVHRADFAEIAQVQCSFLFEHDDSWTAIEEPRTLDNPLLQKLIARGQPGLVIFSSGSTGKPKAVLHDFSALLGKFRRPSPATSILTFLLFDHIGGMDTLFTTLANGGTAVSMQSRDPDVVCRAIAQHKVHTLPASPTFLNLLLISGVHKQHDLSSLKVIAYGTEPMPAALLARLQQTFPGVKLAQTYGISELGVMRTRSREDGSLWLKFSQEDGEYLRILGRVSELVNVGGQKVFPAEVENVVLQMDNVRDAAVYGERNPLTGQSLAVRVNLKAPEPFDVFRKRLRAFCRERLPSYKIPTRVEITDQDQFGSRFKKMRKNPSPTPEGQS
jgi:long-chain acyl-CoA synthetase